MADIILCCALFSGLILVSIQLLFAFLYLDVTGALDELLYGGVYHSEMAYDLRAVRDYRLSSVVDVPVSGFCGLHGYYHDGRGRAILCLPEHCADADAHGHAGADAQRV